ncbi:MAG: glycosyltransferase [Chloroflexota bacterium]|nr:glycosyltransferase [Chloroflexota bacterium]
MFFTTRLGGGGAERHLLRLINHLDRDRFRPSLVLARAGGSYEVALAPDVAVHFLNSGRVRSSTRSMVQSMEPLRRRVEHEQPDILCSVLGIAHVVALLACRSSSGLIKNILSVQNPPSIEYQRSRNPVHRLIGLLIPRLYPRADQINALSRGVARDVIKMVPAVEGRTDVVYNAGFDGSVLEQARDPLAAAERPNRGPLVLACGRLTKQKGFEFLLEAFVNVRRGMSAQLWIIGEGEQRRMLEQMIERLGLTDCVRLLGFQPNPFKYMAAADAFVLPSIWEGFGNVIVEAMACGTPVIASNCRYGPAEIITDEMNGILVPPADPLALSQALIRVLSDSALRQHLSQNGQERSKDFSAAAIASLYESLFLRVVHDQPKSDDGSEVELAARQGVIRSR